jgi:hypothetical protein
MASFIDWSKLVATNRVKAPGIDWNPKEMEAINNGADPEEIRAGNFTPDEIEKKDKPLERMKKPILVERAKALKIETITDYEAATRLELIAEIKRVETEAESTAAGKVDSDK